MIIKDHKSLSVNIKKKLLNPFANNERSLENLLGNNNNNNRRPQNPLAMTMEDQNHFSGNGKRRLESLSSNNEINQENPIRNNKR